ncbi:hypothetical protein CF65_00852 [Aggregatibacter actinomycetemcomitans HK1651]|nr:hypothetical protein CF65_00852 [Aggregatibacter actinomycetemcomitans HK1651]
MLNEKCGINFLCFKQKIAGLYALSKLIPSQKSCYITTLKT